MTAHNIVVATFSRATFLLIERATRNQGIPCVQVDLTVEAVAPLLSEDSQAVLVVDALQQEAKAMDFCKIIQSKYPTARILILGNRADIATVVRAIRAGAANVFMLHTPLDELMTLMSDAVANKPPSVDSVFGRVWSALPSSPDKEGVCHSRAGGRYPVHEAIKCCQSLGLSPDETAEQLKLSMEMMAKIVKQSPAGPTTSVLSRLGDLLPSGDEARGDSGAESSVKPLLSVFGLLFAIFVGWRFLSAGETITRTVSGAVIFQGNPVKCGMIRFIPEGGGESPKPIVTGEIRNGRYQVKSAHSSDGGSYRVVISGFTGVPKQVGPLMDPLGDQLFPDNTRSATLPCSDYIFDVVCDTPPQAPSEADRPSSGNPENLSE